MAADRFGGRPPSQILALRIYNMPTVSTISRPHLAASYSVVRRWYDTVRHNMTLYNASYSVVQCRTVSYSVVQCRTVSYNVVLALYDTVRRVVQCRTVSYSVVQCRTASYNVVQCRMRVVGHCTASGGVGARRVVKSLLRQLWCMWAHRCGSPGPRGQAKGRVRPGRGLEGLVSGPLLEEEGDSRWSQARWRGQLLAIPNAAGDRLGQLQGGCRPVGRKREAAGAEGRDALEGKGPQRREEVAKAVGGGYCRLQMPKRALGIREAVAGRRHGALEGPAGGYLPAFQCIPGGRVLQADIWGKDGDGTPLPGPGDGGGRHHPARPRGRRGTAHPCQTQACLSVLPSSGGPVHCLHRGCRF